MNTQKWWSFTPKPQAEWKQTTTQPKKVEITYSTKELKPKDL